MSEIESHHKVPMGSERNFGLVFCLVFSAIAVFPVIFQAGPVRWWSVVISFVFGVLAIVAPGLLAPLNRIWFLIGLALGKIVAPVVMMLVFFVAVTPTAMIARLVGKDFLKLSKRRDAVSYWGVRKENPEQSTSMKNQF